MPYDPSHIRSASRGGSNRAGPLSVEPDPRGCERPMGSIPVGLAAPRRSRCRREGAPAGTAFRRETTRGNRDHAAGIGCRTWDRCRWCGWSDSNRHSLRKGCLRPSRLPFRHTRTGRSPPVASGAPGLRNPQAGTSDPSRAPRPDAEPSLLPASTATPNPGVRHSPDTGAPLPHPPAPVQRGVGGDPPPRRQSTNPTSHSVIPGNATRITTRTRSDSTKGATPA